MPRDTPGKIVAGRYELIAEVGAGGMATVWSGLTHGAEGFRRPVAIKRIRDELRRQRHVREMFVEEARVGAALRHPNIVQVHDFGVDEEGDYYLITERVEGIHLEDYVRAHLGRGEETDPDLIAIIAVEVLRALNAAHTHRDAAGKAAPILHRDVTPHNILLDVNGIVKLADFGMARASDRGRITHPDIIKGKLSYMAPEMTRGVGPNVQTDLFGLGIVCWEALSGQRLFQAETDAEVFRMLQDPRIPLLGLKRPAVPLSLATIVHRALEVDPARRFRTAQEMLRALTDDLRTLPRAVHATSLAESVVRAREWLAESAAGTRADAQGA